MREDNWHRMFLIALLLHVFVVAAISLNIKKPARRIDLSHYSVTLVGDIGGGAGAAPKAEGRALPDTGKKVSPPVVQKKVEPKKTKPIPEPKEKERPISTTKERSLTPAKKEAPQPEVTTEDEVRRLDQRIREMKSRQYADVVAGKNEPTTGKGAGGTGAPSTSSGGGSGPLDAQTRYILEVAGRIREVWSVPTLLASKKNLATAVSIKIRKDGRIIDWSVDERSGNRVYDESVARALRTIDKLPPVPDSLPDPFDAPIRFLPPGQ